MRTNYRRSEARKYLETLRGGPLTLGALLRSIRLGEDESLAHFAKRLGVSAAHLSDLEMGRKMVSAERAAKFAKALKRPQEQFIRLALEEMLQNAGLRFRVTLEAA